ncbi:peroxide stress protein YaaA [Curvibacter sp. CHRR-16]|uniref:peroxide stress protein YaaA n=1 Tax=Curvibacter sp. CHRR-16 TaxID=2835872 RepID=UPI001BDAB1A1|nr:peroxide stress protein YaaA [Curvibacter sp. CHRR-16]MBT0571546.1 peroxide stress protein YaaA [Curvibacter sp. CHRR-16]
MLMLLSPAKSLDYETPLADKLELAQLPHTQPLFTAQSQQLIALLRPLSVPQVASLMDLSDKLAALNVARYAAWSPVSGPDNALQAVLAFDGDVYDGLAAKTLTAAQLQWLQQHLCILSGLYGVLRPLDWLQPYRLEMGTALAGAHGKDLYQFWGTRIAAYLNQRLQEQGSRLLLNLASQEYFKAVDRKALQADVVECVFQDYKNGVYKIISFHAKRARGLMARFVAQQQVMTVEGLKDFAEDGYALDKAASSATSLVFRRKTV